MKVNNDAVRLLLHIRSLGNALGTGILKLVHLETEFSHDWNMYTNLWFFGFTQASRLSIMWSLVNISLGGRLIHDSCLLRNWNSSHTFWDAVTDWSLSLDHKILLSKWETRRSSITTSILVITPLFNLFNFTLFKMIFREVRYLSLIHISEPTRPY